ncbi:hypothetical protein BH24ACI1_BH24ACI1_18490 [soil metagenome]|jgi:hypothetical protein|nr:hypothetical protein [Pyrinomonadaceae bacterium]
MKKTTVSVLFVMVLVSLIAAQRKRSPAKPKPKSVIFAVLNDGQTLEPIAAIDKGELVASVGGDSEPKPLTSFVNTYYKPQTTYNLIFGGAMNGKVTVKSSNPNSDCGKNLATVTTQSAKAKLKGMVMGLATNEITLKPVKGVRRLPTAAERTEIESLVRAEFAKQKVSANALKKLRYYNLTALDLDDDGEAEMVGSFWVESSAKERNILFFIAEKNSGKYKFGFSEYKKITPDEIMSGDLKDLDTGIGSELLLDALEYNGDTTAEVFTINKAFEGNNFHVYSRQDRKWTRVFEGYNYHCAY